jgi:hypothetical protein
MSRYWLIMLMYYHDASRISLIGQKFVFICVFTVSLEVKSELV